MDHKIEKKLIELLEGHFDYIEDPEQKAVQVQNKFNEIYELVLSDDDTVVDEGFDQIVELIVEDNPAYALDTYKKTLTKKANTIYKAMIHDYNVKQADIKAAEAAEKAALTQDPVDQAEADHAAAVAENEQEQAESAQASDIASTNITEAIESNVESTENISDIQNVTENVIRGQTLKAEIEKGNVLTQPSKITPTAEDLAKEEKIIEQIRQKDISEIVNKLKGTPSDFDKVALLQNLKFLTTPEEFNKLYKSTQYVEGTSRNAQLENKQRLQRQRNGTELTAAEKLLVHPHYDRAYYKTVGEKDKGPRHYYFKNQPKDREKAKIAAEKDIIKERKNKKGGRLPFSQLFKYMS